MQKKVVVVVVVMWLILLLEMSQVSSVLMTSEVHNSYNQFYSTVFGLLYMFRTNLVVHHQEHKIMYCITQFGTIGTLFVLLMVND